jgi:hypothetical protein
MASMKITAVIPTRGDVDTSRIVTHLRSYQEISEVLVIASGTAFSRYKWARRASTDWIYTQDDDCITHIAPLIAARSRYDPFFLVNAMTPEHAAQYPGAQTLLGFGTIFHRSRISVFDGWLYDDLFHREADRIFGTVVPHKTEFPHIEILPCASAPNRLWKQPDHLAARAAMNQRIKEQTGIDAGCL